jgi:hypothetical protein
MQSIFRFIKRKKNRRRLCAVWILLIAIELLCPAFSHERAFAAAAAAPDSPRRETIVSETAVDQDDEALQSFLLTDDSQNHGGQQQQSVCNDECLCHASAIQHLAVPTIEPLPLPGERIASISGRLVYNSLPPPYIPPKRS